MVSEIASDVLVRRNELLYYFVRCFGIIADGFILCRLWRNDNNCVDDTRYYTMIGRLTAAAFLLMLFKFA